MSFVVAKHGTSHSTSSTDPTRILSRTVADSFPFSVLSNGGSSDSNQPPHHFLSLHLSLSLPTAFQLQWQQGNMVLFFHFGMNTFNDSEWGSSHANPTTFNPTKLNASQWVNIAKESVGSPWGRHDPSYGDTLRYKKFYLAQMTELLTK